MNRGLTQHRRTWPAVCMILGAISISQLVLNEIAWGPGDPGTGAPSFLQTVSLTFACALPGPTPMKATLRPSGRMPLTPSLERWVRFRMSDDIHYNKTFDLVPGEAAEVAPGVRAVVANNPGPFTFKGTVSYVIGHGKVAILDPGPDDDAHIAALLEAVRGETVTDIFVTHTHRDHSPAVPKIKAATGATIYAEGPHRAARPLHTGEASRLDASGDMDFRPDVGLADGAVISGDGWTIEAIATPGHTANHMAYAFKEADLIFSGDHVMVWSTSIVAPPDGAMSDYMASLEKLARRREPIYLPGHGGLVRDAPRFVQSYIAHRKGREESILRRLGKGAADIPTLVRAIYIGLDPRLTGAASLSVLAHLEDLVARGVVTTEGTPSIAGTYRLTEFPLPAA
jgi:glyoxylase-like metal-dependent hydrolase (beta-lactamase superfamily II)